MSIVAMLKNSHKTLAKMCYNSNTHDAPCGVWLLKGFAALDSDAAKPFNRGAWRCLKNIAL